MTIAFEIKMVYIEKKSIFMKIVTSPNSKYKIIYLSLALNILSMIKRQNWREIIEIFQFSR